MKNNVKLTDLCNIQALINTNFTIKLLNFVKRIVK